MVAGAACRAREVAEHEWDSLVDRFADHTVYHRLPWLRTVAQSHGLHLHLLATDDDCGPTAIWPLLEMRKGPFRILGSPLPGWSTAYLGPLVADHAGAQRAWRTLLAAAPVQRSSYLAVKVIGTARSSLDFSACGFQKVTEFDTYAIDLRPTQELLWSRLRPVCRNEIRKSQRLGVEVGEEFDDSFLDSYWAMTCETFARRQAVPTHSRQFIANLWSCLRPEGLVRAISARWKGDRIATVVLLRDHRAMYYWGSASHLAHRKLYAHRLLVWEAILLAQQDGLEVMDLISTAGGPGEFKKSFGPERVFNATHWERSASPLVAAAKSVYERYVRRRQFGIKHPAWHLMTDLAGAIIGRSSRGREDDSSLTSDGGNADPVETRTDRSRQRIGTPS